MEGGCPVEYRAEALADGTGRVSDYPDAGGQGAADIERAGQADLRLVAVNGDAGRSVDDPATAIKREPGTVAFHLDADRLAAIDIQCLADPLHIGPLADDVEGGGPLCRADRAVTDNPDVVGTDFLAGRAGIAGVDQFQRIRR